MHARILSVLVFIVMFGSTSLVAQATRTWVSGDGDDTDPCSYPFPCKTFAGAYTRTITGGVISVKDAGSYGPLFISKSITIDGGENYAGVLHPRAHV